MDSAPPFLFLVAPIAAQHSMLVMLHHKALPVATAAAKLWRRTCFIHFAHRFNRQSQAGKRTMLNRTILNLDQIKITRRDQEVLRLLVQGCSNKDIAAELKISPRTVKQHLRTLFLRAGIKQGRKRVILATAIFQKEQLNVAS
jgi:DNA-binding NarL/FixJ family response regulator